MYLHSGTQADGEAVLSNIPCLDNVHTRLNALEIFGQQQEPLLERKCLPEPLFHLTIIVLPVYHLHAKATSPVPMGLSLYVFEVQPSVSNTFVLLYPELLDVSLVVVRKEKCQLSLPCCQYQKNLHCVFYTRNM